MEKLLRRKDPHKRNEKTLFIFWVYWLDFRRPTATDTNENCSQKSTIHFVMLFDNFRIGRFVAIKLYIWLLEWPELECQKILLF